MFVFDAIGTAYNATTSYFENPDLGWRREKYRLFFRHLGLKCPKNTNPKAFFQEYLADFRQNPTPDGAQKLFSTSFYTFAKSILLQKLEMTPMELATADLRHLWERTCEIKSWGDLSTDWMRSLDANTNLGYDPFLGGNIPSKLYTVNSTAIIRAGTPTYTDPSGTLTITPEFQSLLDSSFVYYLNFQGTEEQNKERERSMVIARAVTSRKFCSLSHDSEFYNNPQGVQSLIFTQFLHSVTHSNYDLLSDQESKEIIHKILSDVFMNKIILSIEEQRAFIDIYYAWVELAVILKGKPDFLFPICRDGADRTNKNQMVFLTLVMALTGKDYKLERAVTVFAYVLLNLKREVKWHRFERGYNCLQFLENEQVRENLRKRGESMQIELNFHEDPSQWYDIKEQEFTNEG